MLSYRLWKFNQRVSAKNPRALPAPCAASVLPSSGRYLGTLGRPAAQAHRFLTPSHSPVIARDLGALPEIVGQAGGGFIYRDNDQLLAAARRLAGSPALRSDPGAKGDLEYLRSWTRRAHLQRYARHIDDVRQSRFGISGE